MSALPNAVAQAAAATAYVPASVLHEFVAHSLPMRLPSSVVMLLAGGALAIGVLPSTRAARALVTVATPSCCLPIVASLGPEYMTEPLEEAVDGLSPDGVDRILEIARDVVAIGPGLGQAPSTRAFVKTLVDRATMPLVVDADGLNAFGVSPSIVR